MPHKVNEPKSERWWRTKLEDILRGNRNIRWVSGLPDSKIESLIEMVASRARTDALKELAPWIDENVGVSSKAIYLYMTTGKVPFPFDAPGDSGDRGRCIKLLEAVPEWVDRLREIERLNIEGISNDKKVTPWNEQIPLIRAAILSLIKEDER